jgi:hypothetical protein
MKHFAMLSIAVVLLAFGLNGAAQAQQQQSIYACVNNSSGTIKIVAPGATCDNGATLFVWNTGVLFSEYSCAAAVPSPNLIPFAFDGNTSGAGIGGNSVAPVTSFVLQPGIYQFLFKTSAFFFKSGPAIAAEGFVQMNLDNAAVTSFPLVGAAASPTMAAGTGSKIVKINQPNQTVSFSALSGDNTISLFDCYLTIMRFQ